MQALRLLFFLVSFHCGLCLNAQENDPAIRLALQLDSIAASAGPSSHFARLYTETVLISLQHYQHADTREKEFIQRFEQTFAGYFFRAAASRGQGPGSEPWKVYFGDSLLSPLQYQLLGINAHINADLSAALSGVFSAKELEAHKKSFLRFQKGLRKQFRQFYDENVRSASLTRLLDKLTLGLTRSYGSVMMVSWRKRQFRLALWKSTHPQKEARLKTKITRRKERIDRLILRHL
jgi:Family of unknown function (DUF5995)